MQNRWCHFMCYVLFRSHEHEVDNHDAAAATAALSALKTQNE